MVKNIEDHVFFFFDPASEVERFEKKWTDPVGQHLVVWLLITGVGFYNHGPLFEDQELLRRGGIHLTKV